MTIIILRREIKEETIRASICINFYIKIRLNYTNIYSKDLLKFNFKL